MADVILKNILGQDITYLGIDTLKLKNTAGGEETFVIPTSVNPVYSIEETALNFSLMDEETGWYSCMEGLTITHILDGGNYNVTMNGDLYSCKAYTVDRDGSKPAYCIGNPFFIGGEDTGVPFIISIADGMAGIVTIASNETINVSIQLNLESGGGSNLELEETQLNFVSVGEMYGYVITDSFPEIKAGASYTITWDGTTYSCTALELDGAIILGNLIPLTGADSGEPFLYFPNMATGDGMVFYSIYDTAEATHTVSIKLDFSNNGDPVYNMDTTTLTFADVDGIYQCVQNLPITHVLDGANYIVTIDGTAYPTKGCVVEGMGSLIGNCSMVDSESFEDTGEPFVILLQLGIEGIMTTLTGESHDISIALNFEGGGGGITGYDLLSADTYEIVDDTVTEVVDSAFMFYGDYGGNTRLVTVDLPNAESIGVRGFYQCRGITKLNLPKAKTIGDYALYYCKGITSIDLSSIETIGKYGCNSWNGYTGELNLPTLKTVGMYAFQSCYASKMIFPNLTSVGSSAFAGCIKAEIIDIGQMNSSSNACCKDCYSLKAFVIRSTTFCYAPGTNTFTNCYHILGTTNATYNPNGDKDGYIYVPRALVDTYKSATYWSANASQFRALEDYTVDGTTTGELDETKI